MSNHQINKMLFLEGIFYGLDSLIFGILISMILIYIIYLFMVDIEFYKLSMPYVNIIISIVAVYIIIFYSIISAKKKLDKENNSIVEVIRNENI